MDSELKMVDDSAIPALSLPEAVPPNAGYLRGIRCQASSATVLGFFEIPPYISRRQFMFLRCLSVLLLASLAVGQATPAASPQTPAQAPAPAPPSSNPAEKTPEDIAPTTPVIVVDGVCEKAPASKTAAAASKAKTAADCKTIVTKAEFESLAN